MLEIMVVEFGVTCRNSQQPVSSFVAFGPNYHKIIAMEIISGSRHILISLLVSSTISVQAETVPKDENVAAVVRFTNSLVPPLFQTFSSTYSNLVVAPFGLSTSIAIMMDCVHGKSFKEITDLFRVETKAMRQQLRQGFKTILHEFKYANKKDELAGSYNKAFLVSSKMFPASFTDQISKIYAVDIKNDTMIGKNISSAQVLELRTDTGIMSHWQDYQKLVVYTYLSYSSAAPFYTSAEKNMSVPMIPLVGFFKAGHLPKLACTGAELLFENERVSLLLLMPDTTGALDEARERLFVENFFEVLDSLPQHETQVQLPQLSIVANNVDFAPFFLSLGITSAFLGEDDLRVRSILQNAFFSTTFTALNSIGTVSTKFDDKMDNSNDQKRQKRETSNKIVFNKPFMFFLIHRESGLILLTGQVTKPDQVPVRA